jgi:tRNA nucleotidyltransferase (CCA-adding enzyme)
MSSAEAIRTGAWEHFPHDADLGVRGFGATVEEAFENAARALTAAVTEAEIAPLEMVEVECDAPDLEYLLVDWLNRVIYEMAVRRMVFGRFTVRISDSHLTGVLAGEPVEVGRHAPSCEPKGATYTALRVAQDPTRQWSAGCVVDV